MDWNNINRDRDTSGLGPIEYDQTKVPSLIRKHADNVRGKSYGQQVREAQARNAEYAGLIASEAVGISNATNGRQINLENTFNSLQQEITNKDIISAPEIIAARNGEGDLKSRLDSDKQEASAKITLNVGISIEDFPRLSPEDDDMPRFQRAINSLSPENPRLIVTNKQAYTFKFKQGSTIQNPTRVEVKQDGVEIIGIGKPVIKMVGLTKTYLDSIDDYASSGRDIFTAFSIMGAKDISVDNIEFIGEYNPGIDGYFRYASPRAIAIGVKGGTNVQISNVKGSNILGNVVNAVNSNIAYDVGYATSEHVKIINSQAIDCLENGFNFMGGTKYGFVSGLFGEGNANGLETGCEDINIVNCIFDRNRGSAVGISGKGVVLTGVIGKNSTGETGKDNGYGIAITGGSDIYISGGNFTGNKGNGLIIYPGTDNISIDGTDFSNSGEQSTYKTNVYAVGTEAQPIKNLKINNGSFVNDLAYNGIFNWTEKLEIINSNGVTNANVSMVVNDKSTNSKVVDNDFNKAVAGSDISGEYRNNGNKRITEMSSVPTIGTWRAGDTVINSYTGLGVWVEAVCVMGGTFGASQEPIFRISRQNGHKNDVSTKPDFVGQTAQILGASPKFYVATGTASPSDWQLIS